MSTWTVAVTTSPGRATAGLTVAVKWTGSGTATAGVDRQNARTTGQNQNRLLSGCILLYGDRSRHRDNLRREADGGVAGLVGELAANRHRRPVLGVLRHGERDGDLGGLVVNHQLQSGGGNRDPRRELRRAELHSGDFAGLERGGNEVGAVSLVRVAVRAWGEGQCNGQRAVSTGSDGDR